MGRLLKLTRRVAQVDATVLITGESGTGKERIAELLHAASPRAQGPFIAINCGAIPESLLESELFGHARGAFTGAIHDRPGLMEAASAGTLLLDELGEISPHMQVLLLRALQTREIRRVGENKGRHIDVRILASTHRDLNLALASGALRQDLYYRLKVVELRVPPLRERHEDILPLAEVLLADAAARMRRAPPALTAAAAERLLDYAWPGNVRELENAMEHAVALTLGSHIEVSDLCEELREPRAGPPRGEADPAIALPLCEVERAHILAALELNGGNQTRTAHQLQIGSATLYRKLKSYGLIVGRHPAAKRSKPED